MTGANVSFVMTETDEETSSGGGAYSQLWVKVTKIIGECIGVILGLVNY